MTAPLRSDQELAELVSYHAVTRYVQRILGVVVTIAAEEWPADTRHRGRYEAGRHAAAVGKKVDDIKRLILVPAVSLASTLGMTHVATKDFQAKLGKNGVVITIYHPRTHATHRVRVLSRSEKKAHSNKLHRKMKRRPATCRR